MDWWIVQSNVNALVDMKLEKFKNLREESGFYWREIADGTLKFDRRESEVMILNYYAQFFIPCFGTRSMFCLLF